MWIAACSLPLAAQHIQQLREPNNLNPAVLSPGARAWLLGPRGGGSGAIRPFVNYGSNVDAANPLEESGEAQSQGAIAVAGQKVLAAWTDSGGLYMQPSTLLEASVTGVSFSSDGGHTFTDLVGLPNGNPNQQWYGEASVVAVDNGRNFIVASLYLPSFGDCAPGPADEAIAVSVATVTANNQVVFSYPILAAGGGDACSFVQDQAILDKPWISYDSSSRTLALSYTRFFEHSPHSGDGQIEVRRALVPQNPRNLSAADFTEPIVIWPEEAVMNTGAYVAVAPGGGTYVAWERNWSSNLTDGDPYVYLHAAFVPMGVCPPGTTDTLHFCKLPVIGGPGNPVIITTGHPNSNGKGGVRSLDEVVISGYGGTANDFPRLALDGKGLVFVWNDASLHPFGDIWLRAGSLNLQSFGPFHKVNDDVSGALHFLPALSIRSDGSIATSWYDQRNYAPFSSQTDYYGEIRSAPAVQASDFMITTGPTTWNASYSNISPAFGEYTDNFSTGTTTYFIWTDGRSYPVQPFVDHR